VLNVDDPQRLAIALAEAAADEIQSNGRFAERVRLMYSALAATAPKRPQALKQPTALAVKLVPLRQVEGHMFNPATPPDPYLLLDVYGAEQLTDALNLYPVTSLKEAAITIERRHPRTKPKNRGQKTSLVEYISHWVLEDERHPRE
jgi:hypothetical protein